MNKKYLFLLPLFFLIFLYTSCSSDTKESVENFDTLKKQKVPMADTITPVFENSCIYKKTNKTPQTSFPFNEATRIQVISYVMRERAYAWDTLISEGKFIVKGIKEKVTLSKAQTDSLFSLLYDYQLKTNGEIPMADCYFPRHSIVFYKNDKAIAFYEICFECGVTRSTHNVDFGKLCLEKKVMLKDYFKSIGIKYGLEDYF